MRPIKHVSLFLIIFTFGLCTANSKAEPATQPYQGPIYNLFFHPLIVNPTLAFNRKNSEFSHMNDWFVTLNEFKKILPALYKRGFILFSPKDLFVEEKNSHGQTIFKRKHIFLPPGKKPIILSLDDYNFYSTMQSNGTIHRFWVNDLNKLVVITSNDPTIYDEEEIPQLLEKFIARHPDFAYNNARGIIALTGYNGIFGYGTNKIFSHDYTNQRNEAQKVVYKLKTMGWEFGSHSYFHLRKNNQSQTNFENSERRWQKEVGSIVGPTPYYIFPFGEDWDKSPNRIRFLKSMGYKYFFEVGQDTAIIIEPDKVVMERFAMDGNALSGKYKKIGNFINPQGMLDPARLKSTR